MKEIEKILIIGAGVMGHGIALVCAKSGLTAVLMDTEEKYLENALSKIKGFLKGSVERKKMSAQEAADTIAGISTSTDIESAAGTADLVIEAIIEDKSIKEELFQRLNKLCDDRVIFASNTSQLSITELGRASGRPDRFVGMHWFNPPELVPLVEIIKGEHTSGETAQTLRDLMQEMGKAPVLVNKDVAGFVGNRLQYALLREALHLVATGVASPEDVDTAVKRGLGFRWSWIGPMETADLGGLDVFYSVSDYLFADLCDDKRPQEFFKQRVEAGKLGAKTGEGFYKYSPEQLPEIIGQRDLYFVRQAQLIKQVQGK